MILSPEARAYVEENGIEVGKFTVRNGLFPVVDPLLAALCPRFAAEYATKVYRLKQKRKGIAAFEATFPEVEYDEGDELPIIELSGKIGVPEMTIYSWIGDDKVRARKIAAVSIFSDGRRCPRKIWLVNVEDAMRRREIWLTYRGREARRKEKNAELQRESGA
jgi:hypothetical protein